jgi:exosome complex RNA-binding protein Rrp42 (RNase PH superfamily)
MAVAAQVVRHALATDGNAIPVACYALIAILLSWRKPTSSTC